MTRSEAASKAGHVGGRSRSRAKIEAAKANGAKTRFKRKQTAAARLATLERLADPERRAGHLERLAEARAKSTLPALQIARTMQAQEDAERFVLDHGLLARGNQRGHIVDLLMADGAAC